MADNIIRLASVLCGLVLWAGGAYGAVVVDNDDGAPVYTQTGAWTTSGSVGYNGGTYVFSSPGAAATAVWNASLAESGPQEVFVWYIPGSNRCTSTKYDIQAADGTHTVYVNQTGGGYTWDSLGTFTFNAGATSITLDAAGSSGGSVVIADAVKFGAGGGPPVDPPDPVVIEPGVNHYTWELPTPQVVHVVEFDLADPRDTIEMGFAQGRRNFSTKEPVSQIVDYYDTGGAQVIAATNCAFFDPGISILSILGSKSNYIGPPPTNEWVQQTYMLQESGEGWAYSNVPQPTTIVRFADAAELSVGVLNYTCGEYTLALYTPDWGPNTATTTQGVEVVVEEVNYPLRANKEMVGTIAAVQTGAASVASAIPAGGFVLRACAGAESDLLAHAAVGDAVTLRIGQTPAEMNHSRMMCTGNAWMVKDGVPFHGGGPERHPRTVLAWTGTQHWFVTFDGRQPGYAVGVSVAEMQDFLINYLGVDNAINLDGGGSTTMVINDAVANCPSDGATTPCTGTERSVPNALMLVRREAGTELPIADDFPAAGRELAWDEKFTFNPVVAFSPTAPDGDGYVLELRDPSGGFETASAGERADANYSVEVDVYCEYRPDVAADGYERVGAFARDNGNANFEGSMFGGGECYALTYDSADGRICAGVVTDGVFTDFLEATPLYEPSTAWRRLRIDCYGDDIRYYVDGALIADVDDSTHACGRFGLGYHEYFATDANIHGTHADNFRVFAAFDGDYDGDGDVDLLDYRWFGFCMQGPATVYPPGDFCLWADADEDSDVDLDDFTSFQAVFGGAE